MSLRILVVLSSCILACSPLFISPQSALAAAGVGVVPGRFQVEVEPGGVYENNVVVSNEGDAPIRVRSYAADRRIRRSGNVEYLEPGDARESPAVWLRADPVEFTLAPHQNREVAWKIEVPEDAIPGDYVGVLFFENSPEAVPGSMSVGSRVGATVAVRVPGEVVVSGALEGFKVLPVPVTFGLNVFGKRLASFSWTPSFPVYERGPVEIVASFENTGTARLPVTGEVVIKDLFGRTVGRVSSQEPLNIYPRDVGSITLLLEDVPAIGRFTVGGCFLVGEKEFSSRAVFYTFPMKQALSAVLLGVGVWLLGRIWRERRPYPGERVSSIRHL